MTEQALTQKSALRVKVNEWQGATNLGGGSLANSVHKMFGRMYVATVRYITP